MPFETEIQDCSFWVYWFKIMTSNRCLSAGNAASPGIRKLIQPTKKSCWYLSIIWIEWANAQPKHRHVCWITANFIAPKHRAKPQQHGWQNHKNLGHSKNMGNKNMENPYPLKIPWFHDVLCGKKTIKTSVLHCYRLLEDGPLPGWGSSSSGPFSRVWTKSQPIAICWWIPLICIFFFLIVVVFIFPNWTFFLLRLFTEPE